MSNPGPKVAGAAVALVALLAASWMALVHHLQPAPTAEATIAPVAANGVTLASATIALPDETATLPAGADGALVSQHCTACHSPELILSQPRLKEETWAAEVKKMREAYHAPVAEGDDKAIVAALVRMQGRER